MSPTQEKRAQVARREILEAAKKAFVKRGFRATTIRDISKQSGRSIGCIYHHFGSKENLIKDLLSSESFLEWFYGVFKLIMHDDFPENLEDVGREIKNGVEKNTDSMRLIVWDIVEFEGSHFHRSIDFQKPVLKVLLEKVGERLKDKGLPVNVDPQVAALVAFNAFFDYFFQKALFGENRFITGYDDDEIIQQMSELFLAGLSSR